MEVTKKKKRQYKGTLEEVMFARIPSLEQGKKLIQTQEDLG